LSIVSWGRASVNICCIFCCRYVCVLHTACRRRVHRNCYHLSLNSSAKQICFVSFKITSHSNSSWYLRTIQTAVTDLCKKFLHNKTLQYHVAMNIVELLTLVADIASLIRYGDRHTESFVSF
jgi:hypothetical protein